ncbi:MAG: (Fe-S)-binding protein, partial [Chloroflexota bacterium]
MTTVFEDYRYDVEKCVGCKGCYWVDLIYVPGPDFAERCPSAFKHKFDTYLAFGKGKVGLGLLDGALQYSPTVLDIIYKCNLCGACDVGCKRNLDLEPLLMLEGLRGKVVKDGAGPLPEHRKMAENLAKSNNTLGADHIKRLDWMPEQARVVDKADVVYYPDDATSFVHPEIGRALVTILSALGEPFMVPPAENWSSGAHSYEVGMQDEATRIAKRNVDWMR